MSSTSPSWSSVTGSCMDDSYVLTTSGSKLRVNNPHEDQIRLTDILASLPKLCRFTGHCSDFYSVAQHSVFAFELAKYLGCSREHQLRALIHDFSEAYVNDLNSPVKNAIHQSYRNFEAALDNIISNKLLDKPFECPPVVKTIDRALYHAESIRLMPQGTENHWEGLSSLGMVSAVREVVEGFNPWPIPIAEQQLKQACEEAGLM